MNSTDPSELTPYQARLINLIAAGKTSEEIAMLLNKSRRTVEKQRADILVKLGVDSTAEAIVICTRAHIINTV